MAVGGALFSGGGMRASGPKALVSFKAGKMNLDSGTNLVTADKRKGQVTVEQGEHDQLMHFKWKDRTSGNVEDDLIIFPDDIEFRKVKACTTGRVFILKFKSSSRKMFFWMQESKADKDEENCKKVNDYLNNPPAARAGGGGSGSGSGRGGSGAGGSGGGLLDLSNLGDSELQSLLNNMNQQQLMNLFGGSLGGSGGGSGGMGELAALLGQSGRQRSHARAAAAAAASSSSSTTASSASATRSTPAAPSSTTAAATTTTTTTTSSTTTPAATASTTATAGGSGANIQLSDLQNILSGLKGPDQVAAAASGGPSVDLAMGLTAEAMRPLLSNPDFVKRMRELLPAEHRAEDQAAEEISGTVSSPQFQQALSLFSSAFQSAQLAPLVREFDLGDEAVAAATAGDMEAFVKALQKNKSKDGDGDKKKDEPEDMALD